MKKFSLTAVGRDHLGRAQNENSGRSATTVFGGHDQVLRQTVIALRQGHSLDAANGLDEATVYVLSGRVCLTSNGNQWIGWVGDLLVLPETFDGLDALEDSAILLTVAKPRH